MFQGFKVCNWSKYYYFSGTNAVGKSTILGLLGNSCELKSNKGRPILQSAFRL